MTDLDELRTLLAEQPTIFGGADLDVDTELALDSLATVWLVHLLSRRYGIDERALEPLTAEFTSIRRIHAHVSRLAGPAPDPLPGSRS
ncbi:hypothetical protein OG989_16540 [Micromonospora sp. NBC_01740]|uniref:hypothetical protein n=1 Tax=Micromonospora sp. NBC_01740 TaxID=2975986 RepID=UPI002E15512D|nr:hypothetical protein OG989_16540 [Micromonospora sp. NBC_01740]